jgi:hypothetical protein
MPSIIEYIGEVLPDGYLSVPEDVRQTLASTPHIHVQVTLRLLQSEAEQLEAAWAAFRQQGQDAAPGRLRDASVNHDHYLYGKES